MGKKTDWPFKKTKSSQQQANSGIGDMNGQLNCGSTASAFADELCASCKFDEKPLSLEEAKKSHENIWRNDMSETLTSPDECLLVVEDCEQIAKPHAICGYNVSSNCEKKTHPRFDRPITADTMSALPTDPEDGYLIREQMILERVNEKIHISVIAVDKNQSNNSIHSVAANGDSLGSCAYDTSNDSFLLFCCGDVTLGTIPVAFRMGVPGSGKYIIPLPEPVIFKYLSPNQRKILKVFKERYYDCEICFIQSLSRG
jgi:hypothetical protein